MNTKKNKQSNSIYKTIMTIVATAIVTFVITTVWIYSSATFTSTESAIGNAAKANSLAAKLSVIRKKIDQEYIGEVNENDLIEGAIKGYVAGLGDEYTEYLPAEDMSSFTEDIEGEFVGIGVYITKDVENNQILVYGTIPDSPAEQAGLKTGDIITSVDGVECNGDDYDTITNSIKGKEGTKVNIGIYRNGEELSFEIERKTVEVKHVTYQKLDNNIGYINISGFEGDVSTQFENAYNDLNGQGITSLIIDIRSNGGGIVSEALDIAEMMTDKGQTLLIESDKNGKEEVIKAEKGKTITIPIVLLVNEYSASASEILAGILKEDVDNATIIGNTTYGKGVIQTLYPLTDGSGIKITTNEYFTPNHNKINKVGVEPDINVDDYLFTGTLDLDNDTPLKRAIEELKK